MKLGLSRIIGSASPPFPDGQIHAYHFALANALLVLKHLRCDIEDFACPAGHSPRFESLLGRGKKMNSHDSIAPDVARE